MHYYTCIPSNITNSSKTKLIIIKNILVSPTPMSLLENLLLVNSFQNIATLKTLEKSRSRKKKCNKITHSTSSLSSSSSTPQKKTMDQITKPNATTTTSASNFSLSSSPSPITGPTTVAVSRSKLGCMYAREQVEAEQTKYLRELRRMHEKQGTCWTTGCNTRPANWATLKLGVFVCMSCAQKLRADASNRVKNCLGTYLWHPDEMSKMMMMKNNQ